MNHRVCVRVTQKDGVKAEVIAAKEMKIRRRFLNLLLGRKMNILVISPGNTVNSIEITEQPEGGA